MSQNSSGGGGKFTLLYFAHASQITRRDSETFPAPMPLKKLYALLEDRYPGIKEKVLGSCAVTINLEYVDVDLEDDKGEEVAQGGVIMIREGDEVALIPPVSSG